MGVSARNAMELAVENTNQGGGIIGRRLVIVAKDNAGNPGTIPGIIKEFRDEKVKIIIGPLTSNMAVPIITAAKGKEMLIISPTVSTDAVQDLDDNFIRIAMPASDQGVILANLIEKDGFKKTAVVYDKTNVNYANVVHRHFMKQYVTEDKQVVYTNDLSDKSDSAFRKLAEEMWISQAEACLLITSGIDGATIVQQMRKIGSNIQIYGSGWVKTNDFIKHGGRSVNGAKLVSNYEAPRSSDSYVKFRDQYIARFNKNPNFVARNAYDAGWIVLAALDACQTDDLTQLKNWIIQTSTFEGLDGPFTINKYGDADRKHSVFKIVNGKFTALEP